MSVSAEYQIAQGAPVSAHSFNADRSRTHHFYFSCGLYVYLFICISSELCVSINSSEAQILQKQGAEWKAVETLAEVCHLYASYFMALSIVHLCCSMTKSSRPLTGRQIPIALSLARRTGTPMCGSRRRTHRRVQRCGSRHSCCCVSTAQRHSSVGVRTRTSSLSRAVRGALTLINYSYVHIEIVPSIEQYVSVLLTLRATGGSHAS